MSSQYLQFSPAVCYYQTAEGDFLLFNAEDNTTSIVVGDAADFLSLVKANSGLLWSTINESDFFPIAMSLLTKKIIKLV